MARSSLHQENVFLNNLILSAVFKKVDRRELPNFRTVCKKWDLEASAELRRTVPLIIQADEDNLEVDYVPRLLSGAPPGAIYIRRSLKEMVEYMESLPDADQEKRLRYSTVVLQGWDFTSPSDQQMKLFDACSKGTVDLHMISCKVDFTYFVNVVMARAPNVESLTVDDKYLKWKDVAVTEAEVADLQLAMSRRPVTVQKNVKSLTVLCTSPEAAEKVTEGWVCIFQALPNLEKIVLTGLRDLTTPLHGRIGTEVSLLVGKIMKAFSLVVGVASYCRFREGDHKIRHLDLSQVGCRTFGRFGQLAFGALAYQPIWLPLSVLKIDIGLIGFAPSLVGSSALKLIDANAQSLETLVAIWTPPIPIMLMAMPMLNLTFARRGFTFVQMMEVLQTLELVGPIAFDLKFLRFTPNLRKLVVTPMHRTKYSVDLTDDARFRRTSAEFHRKHPLFMNLVVGAEKELSNAGVVLTSLTELEVGYPLQGPESVALLGKWMPNVETLKIPATPAIFTEICRQWGNTLRKLYLQNPTVIDDHVITGHPNAAPELSSPQLPNVTSLTNLTSFQMEHPYSIFHTPSECDHLIPELTERSILHGFANLEGLRNLKIFVKEPLGEDCLHILDARRGQLSVEGTEVVENCQCMVLINP